MTTKTIKVSNVSLGATDQDLKEFFSFSGEIHHLETLSENERSQVAYVTFKDPKGAETAVLLSGATIVDQPVTVALAPDYKLPSSIASPIPTAGTEETIQGGGGGGGGESAVKRAEDVVMSMLSKGFTLGKDALGKAKSFDEKHQFTSTATAKVASLDQKIGFTDKISAGTSIVNEKVREMDDKFRVSEKTKSALTVAEQKVSSAGSAIMKNRYVLTGTTWVTGAFSRVTNKAAATASGDDMGPNVPKESASTEQEHHQVDDQPSKPPTSPHDHKLQV
ncbi:binding partner of ACD11 1-like isoform X1 [Humulus lupulus]|uniref:binding partner of ACD11 1-like isoform X1 n=1 Tax=Humulus lupulus TaxID=3486 RepID=UPI002B4031F2|nr:binding partner of ACD11 1-like isoform X1 [Humulus lupulus]